MKYNGFYYRLFSGQIKKVPASRVMIQLQHGVLHRQQTIAGGGGFSDYFITGDKEIPQ